MAVYFYLRRSKEFKVYYKIKPSNRCQKKYDDIEQILERIKKYGEQLLKYNRHKSLVKYNNHEKYKPLYRLILSKLTGKIMRLSKNNLINHQ